MFIAKAKLDQIEHDLRSIDGRMCHLEGMARLALWIVPTMVALITALGTIGTVFLPMRQRLPTRRACETISIRHNGLSFSVSSGYFPDGRLAEIFLTASRPGSDAEAIARDAAVVCSIALQSGADIDTIVTSLTKNQDGTPATALGAALAAVRPCKYMAPFTGHNR